jgi:cytochrome d ubiquinol oxidase subunit I
VDRTDLARLQFGGTLAFHFMFVALTLGLVLLVALMQTRWYRTGDPADERMVRFWGLIYVVNYALGVVTGIVNEFQMGLNWAGLTKFVGNVFGVGLAMETMVAFFAEATFLGMWIFGWGRLSRRLHLAVIWLVVLTAYVSAFWITLANAFLQRPGGYEVRGDEAYLTDASALFANANLWIALGHVLSASLTLGGYVVVAVSAYHLLRRSAHTAFFRRSMRTGLLAGGTGALLLLVTGAIQFNDVIEFQPVKRDVLIGAPEELAAYQDEAAAALGPGDHTPPLGLLGAAVDTMMYIGVVMVVLAVAGFVLLRRDRFARQRWFLRIMAFSVVLPVIAMISGWLFREIGRQPWAVYGVLSTEDAVSPGATAAGLLVSLVVFGVLYLTLAIVDYVVIIRIARRGPDLDGWSFIESGTGVPAGAGSTSAERPHEY